VRDYATLTIEDCVDTMDREELLAAALECIRAAFGWVVTAATATAWARGIKSPEEVV
jgi:nicotinamidase-related amidase